MAPQAAPCGPMPLEAMGSARGDTSGRPGAAGRESHRPEPDCADAQQRSGARRAGSAKGARRFLREATKEQGIVPFDDVEGDEERFDTVLRPLFEAYDLDGSGEISRRELLRVELRRGYAQGDTFRAMAALSRMSRVDRDRNGELCFHEFKSLQKYRCNNELEKIPRPLVFNLLETETSELLLERARMGPRYHLGVRRALEEVFYWLAAPTRGAHILPEEWVAAGHVVSAVAKPFQLESSWFSERSFFEGDENGDGRLQLDEFLEVTFSRFEAESSLGCEQLQDIAQKAATALHLRAPEEKAMLGPVPLFLQDAKASSFQLPPSPGQPKTGSKSKHHAASDAIVITGALAREADEAYWRWGDIRIPLRLRRMEDVHAIVRLRLHLSPDVALSALLSACSRGGSGGAVRGRDGMQVVLLKDGNLPGRLPEVSCSSWVAAVLNQHTSTREVCRGLFIKNVRSMPPELPPAPVCAGEGLSMGRFPLPQRRGREKREEQERKPPPKRLWLLHWRTHVVEPHRRLPVMPSIEVGDALVLRMPRAIGPYSFSTTVHMSLDAPLAPPEVETQSGGGGGGGGAPSGKRGGKRGKSHSPGHQEAAKDKELVMQAVKVGHCRIFVELGWEVHEEDVAFRESLTSPVGHSSVARLGPIDIEVEEAQPDAGKRSAIVDVVGPPRQSPGASGASADPAEQFQTVYLWTGARWKESRRKIRQRRQTSKNTRKGSQARQKSGDSKGARFKSTGSTTSVSSNTSKVLGSGSNRSKMLKKQSAKGKKKRSGKLTASQMEAGGDEERSGSSEEGEK